MKGVGDSSWYDKPDPKKLKSGLPKKGKTRLNPFPVRPDAAPPRKRRKP